VHYWLQAAQSVGRAAVCGLTAEPSLQILRVPVPTAHPVTFRTPDRRYPPLYVVAQPSLQAVEFLAALYHSAWTTHHHHCHIRLLGAIVPRRSFSNVVANQSVLNKGDSHKIRVEARPGAVLPVGALTAANGAAAGGCHGLPDPSGSRCRRKLAGARQRRCRWCAPSEIREARQWT
jgi:hypothetical protein